ncbi:hypothetical protein ABEX44_29890, partial [Priestia megaterium]
INVFQLVMLICWIQSVGHPLISRPSCEKSRLIIQSLTSERRAHIPLSSNNPLLPYSESFIIIKIKHRAIIYIV